MMNFIEFDGEKYLELKSDSNIYFKLSSPLTFWHGYNKVISILPHRVSNGKIVPVTYNNSVGMALPNYHSVNYTDFDEDVREHIKNMYQCRFPEEFI